MQLRAHIHTPFFNHKRIHAIHAGITAQLKRVIVPVVAVEFPHQPAAPVALQQLINRVAVRPKEAKEKIGVIPVLLKAAALKIHGSRDRRVNLHGIRLKVVGLNEQFEQPAHKNFGLEEILIPQHWILVATESAVFYRKIE
jgi:hypothetical protein